MKIKSTDSQIPGKSGMKDDHNERLALENTDACVGRQAANTFLEAAWIPQARTFIHRARTDHH